MQNYLKRGFTLIETLIVVAIVLVLAGMAVPTFKDSIADAEVASVKQELQRVRTAIDYYGFQHQGQLPGWDGITWSEIALRSQLMMATDSAGNWANIGTSGYPFGPYLTEGFPANPFNQLDTVLITTDSASFPRGGQCLLYLLHNPQLDRFPPVPFLKGKEANCPSLIP
ncbi:MAG: hypothetical protein COB96_01435 [Planctomycetota bacterium]|nr:MAG: hypothetical protein COB96_01435 [Planctomycetota bacterium]